ncbi:MAG: hypothetical protein ACJATV_001312 [Granulosicoccus sp.]|jgi:hypothetical protein
MNKIKTKREIRQELDDEIASFLSHGGEIKDVERGASGKEHGANLNHNIPLNQEKQTRTLLVDEIKALDERKQGKKNTDNTAPRRPKKKVIYDDFGEPLREVWE